jgi:Flp pilus assembly protein TadG
MMSRILLRRPGRRASRGQMLVIFAISAVALFGILALAFDGGRVLMEQRNLQNAADGAALTGALDIGPGTSMAQSKIAKDNTVYAIEQALAISFSNNYTSTQQHYLNAGAGSNCAPNACSPPYTDGCCTWNDSTGAYTLTITTPYNYNGNENEAHIHVDIVHRLPLMIGGDFFPSLAVHVQSTARNYALPYALYTLKYYDPEDFKTNGNASLTANMDIGTNGSYSHVGSSSIGFNCSVLPSGSSGYGGDLYEFVTTDATGIAVGSVTKGCAAGSADKAIVLQQMPPIHLPPDPYGATTCATAATCVSVSPGSGTFALAPTIPADPSAGPGPRYGSVQIGNGTTLVLMPGVYFFEGTAASSGLLTKNSGASVVTGDCYGYAVPSCWSTSSAGNPTACPSGFIGSGGATLTRADAGTVKFACKSPDFGVLLVFFPHGTDQAGTCTNQNPAASGQFYCTNNSTWADDNQFSIWAGSTVYLSSSPRYHNIVVYVDYTHQIGTTMNYTTAAALATGGCASSACALHMGLGSMVVNVGGGGSISIKGAIVAPDDNVNLGGGTSGSGYGQVISYKLSTQGNGTVAESYNPLALAYSPVIVQ